jgi:NosR/NirI family nitrite reductase transcriptional regulator
MADRARFVRRRRSGYGDAGRQGLSRPGILRGRRYLVLPLMICIGLSWAQARETGSAKTQNTPDRATVAKLIPNAPEPFRVERLLGAVPAWRVDGPSELIGYVASTAEVSGSVGYSGQPIDILVGISGDAKITGAVLVRHNEPVLTLGISSEDIARYVKAFAGYDLTVVGVEAFADSTRLPPIIARATVSTGVIRDAILRTSRAVALAEGLIATEGAKVDRVSFELRSWNDLVKDGAIAHLSVDMSEAGRRFGDIANPIPADAAPFLELWAAILDPPSIGQNLLGARAYSRQMASLGADQVALFIGGSGLHSYRGTGYLTTGIFERLEVIQLENTIRLGKDDYVRLDKLAPSDAPHIKELSLFKLGPRSGFDPAKPFRIEVSAERERPDGTIASIRFPLAYELPGKFLLPATSQTVVEEEPLWVSAWQRKPGTIAIVGVMIVLVTVLFFAQEAFVRRPKLWLYTRTGLLLFTLFFLGWYANGQLSVVQIVAFFHSLLGGFRWETFLIEPVIFILWSFVALGLLFLGRGVYCGWLCPFGALQELLNEGAKRLGIRQIEVPFALQERLWAIKYTLFVVILGLSFYSMERALIFAEIEPFKTAISMRFTREWPFIVFALALLTAGLFIERFFCRYVCPLGAALGIPAKMKLFDWLHRRPQCGRECRFCETQCTVGAIDQLGRINPNECILCLRCQVIMNDEAQCLVLKRRADRKGHGPAVGGTVQPKSADDEHRRMS